MRYHPDPSGCNICIISEMSIWCWVPFRKNTWTQETEMEVRVTSLTITPNDPPGDFVLLILPTLDFAGIKSSDSARNILLLRETVRVPSNYKLQLPKGCFGHLVSRDQRGN